LEKDNKNKNIYEKSLNGPVIFIRHAQSLHNKIALEKGSKGIDFEEKWSKDLIDASITELGLEQTQTLSPKLLDLNFTYVFTSPLNRSIETLYYSLKNNPNFSKLKLFVHPLLNEKVSSSCDLSMKIDDKKKFLSYMNINLDFKYFDEIYNDINKDYFFLDFIGFKKEDLIPNNYEENMRIILEYMKYIFRSKGDVIEDFNSIYLRVTKFKSFLKQFISENKLAKDEKILIYTHSSLIQMSTSNSANTLESIEDMPEDAVYLNNCEAITINLD